MAYDPLYIAPLRIRTEAELDQIVEEELGGYNQLGELFAGFHDVANENEPIGGGEDEEEEDTPSPTPTPTGGGGGGGGGGGSPGGGLTGGSPQDMAALREMILDAELPGEGGGDPFGSGGGQGLPQGAGGVPMAPEDQPVPKPEDYSAGGIIEITPGPWGREPEEVDVGIQTPGRLPTAPGFAPPNPTPGLSYSLTPTGFSSIAARSARNAIVDDLRGQQDQFLGATNQFARDIVGGMRTPYGPTSRMQELEELQLRPPQGLWAKRTLTDAGGGPDH